MPQSRVPFGRLFETIGQLANLVKNRDLLWRFTVRNVAVRHKNSYLGVVWTVMNPLFMLTLYTFVFGIVLEGTFGVNPDETQLDYALGIFIGLTIFGLISETLNTAAQIITSNINFVKKVVFPLEVLPAAAVGASFVNFLISMVMVVIGLEFFGPGLSWQLVWLPVLMIPIIAMALGFAWLLSAIGVFLRDVQHIIAVISQAMFWASGIFFAADAVKQLEEVPYAWDILKWNPLIHAIEVARSIMLWHRPFSPDSMIYLYICGFGMLLLGWVVFMRLKPSFADVI